MVIFATKVFVYSANVGNIFGAFQVLAAQLYGIFNSEGPSEHPRSSAETVYLKYKFFYVYNIFRKTRNFVIANFQMFISNS